MQIGQKETALKKNRLPVFVFIADDRSLIIYYLSEIGLQ